MITRDQIEVAFGDSRNPFKTRDIDHKVVAIQILRDRIPYEVCKSIIVASEHDVLYLCSIEKSLPYLTDDDLAILADCNMSTDEDNFFLFT